MARCAGVCWVIGMLASISPAWLILPVLLGGAVLIVWAARNHAHKVRADLNAFARRTALQVRERTVLGFTAVESLEGEQSGRAIRYWTYTTGSGKSRVHWVTVGVRPRADAGLKFNLTPQNFGSKILTMFGVKEVEVGDPVFDQAWFVRTNQPDFLKVALMPEIRGRLMASPAGRRGGHYKLEAGWVQYAEQGHLGGSETIERLQQRLALLHELSDVAEVFAANPGR